jgi:hypothetical protein
MITPLRCPANGSGQHSTSFEPPQRAELTSFQISGDCLMNLVIRSLHESRSGEGGQGGKSGDETLCVERRENERALRFTTSTPCALRMLSPVRAK